MATRLKLSLLFIIVVFYNGCGAYRSADSLNSSLSSTTEFYKCDPSQVGLSNQSSRRLSQSEQIESLKSLFGEAFIALPEVSSLVSLIPEEPLSDIGGTFRSDELSFTLHLKVVTGLIDELFARESYRNQILKNCSGVAEDANCLDSLLNDFAFKAYRRPLFDDEKSTLRQMATSLGGAAGLQAVIGRLLLSPQHLHLVEVDDSVSQQDNERLKISSYALASRLAFAITGGPPDATLYKAAQQEQLSSKDQRLLQAYRLMETSKARSHIKNLIAQWIFNGLDPSDPNSKVAKHFAVDATKFGAEAKGELLSFVEYIIFEKEGTFQELMTDKSVLVNSDRLSKVYNLPVSNSFQKIADERGGLLGRPAVTLSPSEYSAPINRGVYVRKNILCDQLPSPDSSIVATRLDGFDTLKHEDNPHRYIVTQITKPNNCMGCHSQINPIGFAFESIGPFGDFRNVESIFDDSGNVIATHAIDTNVANTNLNFNDPKPASGIEDILTQLSTEEKVYRCFSESVFSTNNKRYPEEPDSCSLETFASGINAGQSIKSLFAESVVDDGILYRKINGGQ